MKKKNERHIAILLAVMMIFMNFIIAPVMAEGDVVINKDNFTDANFRNYVKTTTTINTNGDNVLSQNELDAVTEISVRNKAITDLKGVEYFTKLTKLYCHENKLKTLDLSKNTELTWINCANNQLTDLDLKNKTKLETLICDDNQLTDLDISKNTKLRYISCEKNQLTDLDLIKITKLKSLYCKGNQLTTLDLSKNKQLITLK